MVAQLLSTTCVTTLVVKIALLCHLMTSVLIISCGSLLFLEGGSAAGECVRLQWPLLLRLYSVEMCASSENIYTWTQSPKIISVDL